jgi:hypothetical protein
VHKSHYRQQEPVIEMALLSRLLIAIEAGDAQQFVGRKLKDINPSGKLQLSELIQIETCIEFNAGVTVITL